MSRPTLKVVPEPSSLTLMAIAGLAAHATNGTGVLFR